MTRHITQEDYEILQRAKKEEALQRLSDFTQQAENIKELTLTDEEMISIYEKDWSGIKCGLGRAVEQAILRKAQEK
jgi:hypothetical protein